MQVVTRRLATDTKGPSDIVDITGPVARELQSSGLSSGTVTLFVTGSTAALTIIEHEPGLLRDFPAAWERLVPEDIAYAHNRADLNGHSHVRASMLGPHLVVPFVEGRMTLGTWQQIVLVEFDTRPRRREVVVQAMGQ